MHVAGSGWQLRWCPNLHISGPLLNRFAARPLHRVVTTIGCEQPRSRADLDLPQIGRLRDFLWRITVDRNVHYIHPDWQRQDMTKSAAIYSLRLIESCPNRAGN